jgi:DnaA regulatory inactivator Hda
MNSRQRILDLQPAPARSRADFWAADSNRAALSLIDRWPDWPGFALALGGPAGSGKSHLLEIWQASASAILLTARDITDEALGDIMNAGQSLALDDADRRIGDGVYERTLFHLYNALKEKNLFLLLAGSAPPARWPIQLPDLKSRLSSIPVAEIGAPDDALLGKLFAKLFADRQITVSAEVIQYLLPRMERSFAAARSLVEKLDELALAEKRPITLPLAKQVLEIYGQ